jgi:serine/threonine protein kinase
VCVLGAVFTDKPIVQPLTSFLWLGCMHASETQYAQVTRLFAALSMGIRELETFYSELDFGEVSKARFFPHITSFTDTNGHKIQFTYERYADPIPEGSKAVFIANTQDGQKIVVKFTEAYNDTGHSLLAANGLAPPLLSCDRSTFSDFAVVVMGYVDGKQLFHRFPYVTPSPILGKVSEALKILHANDLVFGDLRSPNILVTAQHQVQLVDFDWCGKVGEEKYPADINLVDIKWPEGVVPGGPLQFEHDNKMMRGLSRRE